MGLPAQPPERIEYHGEEAFLFPSELDRHLFLTDFNVDYMDSCRLPDGYYVIGRDGSTYYPIAEGRIQNYRSVGIWKTYNLTPLSNGGFEHHLFMKANFDRVGLHGVQTYYDTNGRISRIQHYQHGIKHGKSIDYFDDGENPKEEGDYYLGLKSGKWTYYSYPGIPSHSVSHLDSIPEDSIISYSKNRALLFHGLPPKVINPKFHGSYLIYGHGKKEHEISFTRGLPTHYIQYDEQGKIMVAGEVDSLLPILPKRWKVISSYTEWKVYPLSEWKTNTGWKRRRLRRPLILKGFVPRD